MDKSRTKRPVSPDEASRLLGISVEAVRKRYQRKTLEGYKDEDGRLFVYVVDNVPESPDNVVDKSRTKTTDDLYEMTISKMQNHIDTIEGQLKEKDIQIRDLGLELRRKDLHYINRINELKEEILYLSEPKKMSFFRRLLSGRTDE